MLAVATPSSGRQARCRARFGVLVGPPESDRRDFREHSFSSKLGCGYRERAEEQPFRPRIRFREHDRDPATAPWTPWTSALDLPEPLAAMRLPYSQREHASTLSCFPRSRLQRDAHLTPAGSVGVSVSAPLPAPSTAGIALKS